MFSLFVTPHSVTILDREGIVMSTISHHGLERVNDVLQSHMESTAKVVQVIEMRRRTVSFYGSLGCSPPLNLALGTLHGVATLAKVVDGHLAEVVAVARNAGASWSQIGEALGVSKQAAHAHFRKPPRYLP
ncbi:MAG TPA: hypothetical protein VGJ13_17665 [Pseudonocardiaceae bacterium]